MRGLHPRSRQSWPAIVATALWCACAAWTQEPLAQDTPPPAAPAQALAKAMARAKAGQAAFAAEAKAHPPAGRLWLGPPTRHAITHTLAAEVSCGHAKRWLFFEGWPPAGAGQKLCAPPAGKGLAHPGPPWAMAALPADGGTQWAAQWVCHFTVELRPRQWREADHGPGLADAALAKVAWPPDAAVFLAATPACDWTDPAFQEWLGRAKLRTLGSESELVFARRVMRHLLTGRAWHADPQTPVQLSKVPVGGDLCCWESAQLMVGALRAAGIPARACVGYFTKVPVGYTDPEQKNAHVRVEFFARGIGWVPADPTPLLTAPEGAPAVERLLAARLGKDDGTFVVMHHDLGLAGQVGGASWSLRMLPGCCVESPEAVGEVKFAQEWRAELVK